MYVAGVDIGSVAGKVVITDERGRVAACVVEPGVPSEERAIQVFCRALEENSLSREDIKYVVATGYGRANVPFADKTRTEILCHSRGIHHLLPSVRTIIDIGGQDSKAIKLSGDGRVERFEMNDKCAAGTGRFLEVMANVLGVEFGKWSEMVANAKNTSVISSTCTVFAETEIISKIAQKVPLDEIIAGVCNAIAIRVGELANKLPPGRDICFTGGVAINGGVVQKLGAFMGVNLLVPEGPQSTGALGAALIALDFVGTKHEPSYLG